MTNPNLTAITLIVDRSGSMERLRKEGQGAIDSFIETQHDGDVLWTVALFDHEYQRPAFNTRERPAPELHPRGTTALHDAVGRTIEDLGAALSEMPEADRPGKVIVGILTDGLENASRDYTKARVAELVQQQIDEWNWEFIYLATGLDQFTAEQAAMSINVPVLNTMAVADADHYVGAQSVNSYVSARRGGRTDVTLQDVAKEQGVDKNEG